MKLGLVKIDGISVQSLIAVMTHNPGLSKGQLAAWTKKTLRYTGKVLTEAKAAGLCGCVPNGEPNGRGWYVAADLQAAQEKWDNIAAIRAEQRRVKGLAKLCAIQDAKLPTLAAMPVHRRVGSKSKRPLPFVCRAVNSVFALGQA